MIPITKSDDELFSTVTAAARLGRAHKIVARLSERYGQDWGDPMAGFPYALSMVALMQVELTSSGLDERQAVSNYSEIIESLGDLLYGVPEHWLGRYMRVRMRTMMMPPSHAEYPKFVIEERGRAAKDVEELIARQAETAWQPWFASSYLLAARLVWESEDRDVGKVSKLVTEAAAQQATPIPFRAIGSLLREPFVWYLSEGRGVQRSGAPQPRSALFSEGRGVQRSGAPQPRSALFSVPELPERDQVEAMMAGLF